MGTRGPIPKRSTERLRRNPESRPETVRVPGAVRPAPASSSWHRDARAWYRSLADSGQAKYFEPSDWRQAHVLATMLSRLLADELDPRQQAATFKAWLAGAAELGSTEGARRRMRIEVERVGEEPPEDSAKVSVMSRYRRAVGGAAD